MGYRSFVVRERSMKLITFLDASSIVVALGLCGVTGCATKTFDLTEENDEPQQDGSVGDIGETSSETSDEVSSSDAPMMDGKSDSGRESGDAALESNGETSVVAETDVSPGSDTATSQEHQTATGERYTSSLRKGDPSTPTSYSPALFTETISQIEKNHPGVWAGPYEATCDLSSEGHGTQVCQTIQTIEMGVMICPFGISYVRVDGPSCPPSGSKLNWW
jgi:hypothetical protein